MPTGAVTRFTQSEMDAALSRAKRQYKSIPGRSSFNARHRSNARHFTIAMNVRNEIFVKYPLTAVA